MPCDMTPIAINAEDVFQEFVRICPNGTANNQTKTVMIDTGLTCNGMTLYKEITFTDDSWSLKVRNVNIDLGKQMISEHYHGNSTVDAAVILQIVNNIR